MNKRAIGFGISIILILCVCICGHANDKSEVIGITNLDLLGGEIEGISVCRIGETNLGNLVADAILSEAKDVMANSEYSSIPVIAIQNGGGIRTSIPAGNIFRWQITQMMPYENKLVIYKITPKVLYEILENGVSRISKDKNNEIIGTDGRFPQVAGMRFIYDPSQVASNTNIFPQKIGTRVLSVSIDGFEMALDKGDEETELLLAFNNYCLDGGDGYTMLNSDEVLYIGDTLDDIVAKYILNISKNNTKEIYYVENNRINIGQGLGPYGQAIKVLINGDILNCDVAPVIEDNRILVPLRNVFETINAIVIWNSEEKAVTINKNDVLIKLYIDDKKVELNNEVINVDVPIRIINDRTMISLKTIKLLSDLSVDWDSKYNSVYINYE